jgi:hypothetical protein
MVHEEISPTSPRKCPYCGAVWTPKYKAYRSIYHGCPDSIREREDLRRTKQREYDKHKRKDRVRTGRRRTQSGHYYNTTAISNTINYECQSRVSEHCWVTSPNRFNCPACLEVLENDPDITMDVLGHDLDASEF